MQINRFIKFNMWGIKNAPGRNEKCTIECKNLMLKVVEKIHAASMGYLEKHRRCI